MNFKSERKYINSKIFRLALAFAGRENIHILLQAEAESLGFPFENITKLSDAQARSLLSSISNAYYSLRIPYRRNTPATHMTQNQRRALIKIFRYNFNWSVQSSFAYILNTCPELRAKLSKWEISHSSIKKLFSIMSVSNADKVIKRLDKIKQKKQIKPYSQFN